MNPRVSVLMAVYNGDKYLRAAVESILDQTFTDFEFIIIDDCSSDHDKEILRSFADSRIKIIENQTHAGLTASLNLGLALARGEYVARMDSDDISLPERLARQVEVLDDNPDVGACSTWAFDIDENGCRTGKRETPTGEQLDNFYWRTSLIHPAAMFRFGPARSLRYDSTMAYAQDYDLWLRIRSHHRLSNLSEYLLLYRVHEKSVSNTRAEKQIETAYGAFCRHLKTDRISYAAFLAVMGRSCRLDPLRRALAMFRVARCINKPYRKFFPDDVEYLRQWSREKGCGRGWLSGLTSRAVRFLVRRVSFV